ncbi:MAG: DHH family phosphoesterase [Methylobacter sp.]|nr:DHH family phosphoesterase [Methylobacter sp.]MDP2100178.1 DHH family phosphoesterase [Methylobacter sp.]MDP2426925.1 DHH family phosphoesterase [Methylobacter sp.]MDP3053643.1 DHH family phosphoesterase [Methylobacter sp.]MDP3360786.1 DHH family phosphoesterase [Methylobacter sp.]
MHFDVFNGDADGICALIQLRLAQPQTAQLITGIKRDIQLLDRCTAHPGDCITVLDVSLQANSSRVNALLNQGAHIFYVDHHQPGTIPQHPHLTTLIDTNNTTCTSLLVNQYLQGKYPLWAITAAFGDNLNHSAEQLAATLKLNPTQLETLLNLGIAINYNSYGSCVDDLYFAPDMLYREMSTFPSPFDFINGNRAIFTQLTQGYQQDMANAQALTAEYRSAVVAVFMLPDSVWARRVNGVFGNYLANRDPNRAHAVISHNPGNGYQISVRAPLARKFGAGQLCAAFPSGGGREAAAGINHLPADQLALFIKKFEAFYS